MGTPGDKETLHLKESVGSLGGEVGLVLGGRTWWGSGNLISQSWNCLTASWQHLLAAVSSTFLIWVKGAQAQCWAPRSP